mmetsp:Transcript_11111/g.29520  ORF Transcript_11111/g.29520 Transcript_11111/m.29520 type:complete len:239 (+) Transcript_11111:1289-2005(+)
MPACSTAAATSARSSSRRARIASAVTRAAPEPPPSGASDASGFLSPQPFPWDAVFALQRLRAMSSCLSCSWTSKHFSVWAARRWEFSNSSSAAPEPVLKGTPAAVSVETLLVPAGAGESAHASASEVDLGERGFTDAMSLRLGVRNTPRVGRRASPRRASASAAAMAAIAALSCNVGTLLDVRTSPASFTPPASAGEIPPPPPRPPRGRLVPTGATASSAAGGPWPTPRPRRAAARRA